MSVRTKSLQQVEFEPKAVPSVAVINAARAVVTTLELAWTLEDDHLDQIVAAARGDKGPGRSLSDLVAALRAPGRAAEEAAAMLGEYSP